MTGQLYTLAAMWRAEAPSRERHQALTLYDAALQLETLANAGVIPDVNQVSKMGRPRDLTAVEQAFDANRRVEIDKGEVVPSKKRRSKK